MNRPEIREKQPDPSPAEQEGQDLALLLAQVARGDHRAFETVYGELAGPVYGMVRQVLRDPAQSEEVAQEVLLEVWRTASRFDPAKGSAAAWALTIAHRRAVDRVRSENAGSRREQKAASDFATGTDDVAEVVEASLEGQRVRRCLDGLTELQRESIQLAYYGGYSYPQVAQLLGVAIGTVKTRIRDGLIRMRDCMGGELVKALPDESHVLTGSYALDALSDTEREEFERHLQRCASCQAEVRGLRETAARLAMAKAVRPPDQMEQRVLAATYRTRQLPPLAGERFRRPRRPAWVARLLAGRLFAGRLPAGRPSRDHHRAWVARLVGVAAAASVAAAIALGITQVATQHQLESAQARNAAIAKVVEAPDARTQNMRTSAGGTVTVVFSSQQRAAVITTSRMTSLPSGRVYQLWVMSPGRARSVGLLSQPDRTSEVLASGVRSGDQIGITVEPSGGTSRPTTTPVVVMPLTT